MKALNAALASLSASAKSGFRTVSVPSPPSSARPGSAASTRSAPGGQAVRGSASSTNLRAQAGQGAAKEKVEQAAKEASRALSELRGLVEEGTLARKMVEVEKAAGSVVASLVEMEMYHHALVELTAMRSSLLSWWSPSPSPASPPSLSSPPLSHVPTFVLSLPPSSYSALATLTETLSSSSFRPPISDIVPLVLAIQQYLLGCLFRSPDISPSKRAEKLASLLRDEEVGGPVEWRKALEEALEKGEAMEGASEQEKEALGKRVDAMMTSMFGTVTKGCAGADGTVAPEALLTLRTHTLLYYSTLPSLSSAPSPFSPSSPQPAPEKLDAFHDQHRKILLLYGRSAEALGHEESRIAEAVKGAFEMVVRACDERGVGGREGRKWRELCEVVLHIARRGNDLPFVDRVSSLLGISSPASSSSDPSPPTVDPDLLASQLCAKALNGLSVFETWSKSRSSAEESSVVVHLQGLTSSLPSLTRLRLPSSSSSSPSPSPSSDSLPKIDKTLESLRYALTKHLKSGGRRAESLLTPSGTSPPTLSAVDKAAKEALDRMAAHAARVVASPRKEDEGDEKEDKARRDLITTAVDSLLLLAYSSTVVDDRSTHNISFSYLERASSLVGLPSSSGNEVDVNLSLHYSLRTLSSTFYNLGGTLFNAGMPDAAGRFCRRACEVSSAVLGQARREGLLVSEQQEAEEGDALLEGLGRMKLVKEKREKGRKRTEKEEKDVREAVRDLESLMARRWELVALAQHAVGDKKGAYDAYVSSILFQPPTVFSSLAADASRLPLRTFTSTHSALYKLVQRSTRLGVFDLLLPPSAIPFPSSPSLSPAARGILLELELSALDSCSDKPEARRVSFAIVGALEELYKSGEFPLRRARVLVGKMQLLSGGAAVSRDLGVETAASEVEQLYSTENLSSDSLLAPFTAQYFSFSHLFLAFHAHHSQPSSFSPSSPSETATVEANDLVASSARQALRILRTALEDDLPVSPSAPPPHPGGAGEKGRKSGSPTVTRTVAFQSPVKASPPRPSPPAKAAPPAAAAAPGTRARRPTRAAATPAQPTRSTTRAPAAATTRTRATKAPPATEQVTTPPRPKRGVQLDVQQEAKRDKAAAAAPRTPVKKGGEKLGDGASAQLDDVEKVYGLFDTMAHLLGTLGHQLLKIAFLKFLRRLSSKLPLSSSTSSSPSSPQTSNNSFVSSSALLGREYLRLGKTARAGFVFAQAEQRIQAAAKGGEGNVGAKVQVEYWLLYAEYLAMLGNHDRAAQAYESALKIAEELEQEETTAPAASKIVERTLLLQRVGLASSVCSVMLQRKGELSRSLAPAMQAMRVGTRALNNISRLAPVPTKTSSAATESAFEARPIDHVTALADAPPINQRKSTTLPGGAQAGLSWQLAESLLDATLRVASLHFLRGTPKSADFYAQQALDLAEDLGSSRMMARALAVRADVRLHWGKFEEADADLDRMVRLVGTASCPEATEARRLRADLHFRASMNPEAYKLYLDAQETLETFVTSAVDREAGNSPVKHQPPAKHLSPAQARGSYFTHPSPSPSALRTAAPLDLVLPAVHAYLLRMQVHLLQGQSKTDETQRLLRRLAKLASLEEDKADELKLLAAIQIQDLLARSSSDPILGMLPDSVLSMPVLGIAASGAVVKVGTPRTGPTILNSLKDIEMLLARAISFSTSRSHPAKLRELALLSAMMRTMQASVGKLTRRSTATVAHTLDLATAVTLRREMFDAVEHKISPSARNDELDWPTTSLPSLTSSSESNEHLYSLRDRYRVETAELNLTDSSLSSILPEHWSAVSIHLTPEQDSLLLVRHRRSSEPLLFKLPLDRLARREGEDDAFTYEVAAGELKDIIELSNAGTQAAKLVETKEERAAWWQTRKGLDQRLQELLQAMEDAWLGAFKSVLCDARQAPPEGFAAFKARFERILRRSMSRAANDKKAARFRLDDAIVECLAALPATSREEDLEDLFYYAAESFHFSGVPLAHDETDVDQVVVDLREALEELHGSKSAPKVTANPNEHTFLILDKTLQAFPWESLPCLRGRSVSRLPSLAFLRDRFDLAASRSTDPEQPHDLVVNPTKASFVLNPGGDLKNTQKTFEPWLEEQKNAVGWNGIVARAPLEEEMKASLSQKELFLYFGHGGAEQYVRSQTIRHLPRCAVTMLWGCSSGMLKEQGDFDPVGTPYHYMVAGCPALVANLWDVTDKDIDKFAFSVFRKTGLAAPDSELDLPVTITPPPISLTAAIAQSREVCNLKYLNGAAPVNYGIPVRFSSPTSS
ncbi:hypothetical protein JCM8547_000513 [Rhodosporidiobolus lusitaniae]